MERLLAPYVAAPATVAARLIATFGSVADLLATPAAAVERVVGAPDARTVSTLVGLLRGTMDQVLTIELDACEPLSDQASLERYLQGTMAHLDREEMRVLFLNGRNALLRDEVLSAGTVNATGVFPREIMKRALELGATALILAHNHPSGDREPSREDLIETRRICDAARTLDISVHDHLIVTRHGMTSLRARNLMPTAERDEGQAAPVPMAVLARRIYAARVQIGRYFADDLFADPARDILLELFADAEEGRLTDVTMSCISSRVPASTALRWLATMAERGLIVRSPHPSDRRRWLVSLTPAAREGMRAYLTSIAGVLSGTAARRGSIPG